MWVRVDSSLLCAGFGRDLSPVKEHSPGWCLGARTFMDADGKLVCRHWDTDGARFNWVPDEERPEPKVAYTLQDLAAERGWAGCTVTELMAVVGGLPGLSLSSVGEWSTKTSLGLNVARWRVTLDGRFECQRWNV